MGVKNRLRASRVFVESPRKKLSFQNSPSPDVLLGKPATPEKRVEAGLKARLNVPPVLASVGVLSITSSVFWFRKRGISLKRWRLHARSIEKQPLRLSRRERLIA